MHINRSMVVQIALSALLFFILIRVFSFLGFGVILLFLMGAGVWYGVRTYQGKTMLSEKVLPHLNKSKGSTQARERTRPTPPPDVVISHEEREEFNSLVRGWNDEDQSEGKTSS